MPETEPKSISTQLLQILTAKRSQLQAQLTRFTFFLDDFRINNVVKENRKKYLGTVIYTVTNNIPSEIKILDDSDVQRLKKEQFEEQTFFIILKAKQLNPDFIKSKSRHKYRKYRILEILESQNAQPSGKLNANSNARFTISNKAFNKISESKTFAHVSTQDADLPTGSFGLSSFKIPSKITLADPNFAKIGPVDVLLGAEIFLDLSVGQIRLGTDNPIIQKTHVGCIIAGPIYPKFGNRNKLANPSCNISKNLGKILENFGELKKVTQNKNFTSDELKCESDFISNVKRTDSGRFVVALPRRDADAKLGESLNQATKRFLALERSRVAYLTAMSLASSLYYGLEMVIKCLICKAAFRKGENRPFHSDTKKDNDSNCGKKKKEKTDKEPERENIENEKTSFRFVPSR
ncbi:hypothetical protein NQ317_011594 [Molorchus minor]|uniref:Uncharacterized protein n=1 Tax=Molorchus minor TaxID=1323400 RepID=A0ABQ9JDX0_9CUCU|nr:hypothetical protein NQ317_011594 [Molorchus minor]